MNIQNISSLTGQLESLGFENTGYLLLKRICFKPDSFVLSHKIEKGKDRLRFEIYLEKDKKNDCYVLKFNDAVLRKGIELPHTIINGTDIMTLDKQMDNIDWEKAFDLNENRKYKVDDKLNWEEEEKIETVIESLIALDAREDGKQIASNLKIKYWADISSQELVENISSLKNRTEVSQRFYFFEGQPGISADEAYRFLQNKWVEKEMQVQRKQINVVKPEETGSADQAAAGSGLLKKKRSRRSK